MSVRNSPEELRLRDIVLHLELIVKKMKLRRDASGGDQFAYQALDWSIGLVEEEIKTINDQIARFA